MEEFMMKNIRTLILISLAILTAACGNSSNNVSGEEKRDIQGQDSNRIRVNWENIPAEFNPRISDYKFNLGLFKRIKVNVFSFADDIEVVYTRQTPRDLGMLRLYTVFKNKASFGNINFRNGNDVFEISSYGLYQCSKKITNGNLVELDGGCYLRVQIVLPEGAQVEVYNIRKLLTKRFYPVDTVTFMRNFSEVSSRNEKFAVIDDYINSYAEMNSTPSLYTRQLQLVIEDFMGSDDKLNAFSKLQQFVVDREKLPGMIDNVFSFSDAEKARRIIGI